MGYRKASQLLGLSLVFLTTAAWFGSLTHDAFKNGYWISTILWGFISLTMLIMGLLVWDMMRLQPSDSHSLRSLLFQYIFMGPVAYYGHYILSQLPKQGRNKGTLQSNFLMDLLQRNRDTSYGEDHMFSEIKSPEDFIKKHPLTDYSHYENYVKRVVDDGEANVMFNEKVIHLAITSGTTGKNKYYLMNKHSINNSVLAMYYHILGVKSSIGLRRIVGLRYKPKVTYSKSGIPTAPGSHVLAYLSAMFVSPTDSYQITTEKEALYVHALFGLIEEDVRLIDGFMSPLTYSFFKLIEENFQQLCDDIESGHINEHLDIPLSIRASVSQKLIPHPARAAFLRNEFGKGFKNIAQRIWPRLTSVSMISTGSFAGYAKLLQDYYFGSDICTLSLGHGASEGMVGLCISKEENNLVILPMVKCFYEFIEECDVQEESPRTYLLDQVEPGKSYEVVLTNSQGLYRYRLGDVIKITGFSANCPAYEYQYRLGQLLNVYWEKTPESVFYNAIQAAVKSLPEVDLRDYTSVENNVYEKLCDRDGSTDDSKYYVLFVELNKDDADYILSDTEKKKFDSFLCSKFELYNTLRQNGSIGEMHVIQIKSGGFMRLKFHMIRESGNQQFKMPRVLRKEKSLSFLLKEKLELQE